MLAKQHRLKISGLSNRDVIKHDFEVILDKNPISFYIDMEDEEYLQSTEIFPEQIVSSDGLNYVEFDSRIRKTISEKKERTHHHIVID